MLPEVSMKPIHILKFSKTKKKQGAWTIRDAALHSFPHPSCPQSHLGNQVHCKWKETGDNKPKHGCNMS